jgi:hypothetical protein
MDSGAAIPLGPQRNKAGEQQNGRGEEEFSGTHGQILCPQCNAIGKP